MSQETFEYAMVEGDLVTNTCRWDGKLPDAGEMSESIEGSAFGAQIGAWAPPPGVDMVRVTDETGPANPGDTWDGDKFVPAPAPAAPPAPPPTAAQVLAQRDALLAAATLRIDPLEDAIDLNIETADDVDALTAWKQYRVALNRIEQQTGFPADVEWPTAPQ